MRYPSELFKAFPDGRALASALMANPRAPQGRRITRASVYMWKSRDWVPYMWQPAVSALASEIALRGDEKNIRSQQ